jgi:hypothetical protein
LAYNYFEGKSPVTTHVLVTAGCDDFELNRGIAGRPKQLKMKTMSIKQFASNRALLASTILIVASLLTGCVVTSVYPFYRTKDLAPEPALLGAWREANKTEPSNETWTFESMDTNGYKLTVTENDKRTEFDVHLFKLHGQTFLDLLPRERADGCVAAHLLMRVDTIAPQLKLRLLNYEWLAKLVEKSPRTIRHVVTPKAGQNEGGELVLTADTGELQKFIRKHLDTTEAWADATALQKK